MTTYLRATIAIGSLLVLAACAAPASNIKPDAAQSPTVAQNPGCLTQTGSRIAGNGTSCSGVGRSYSSEDVSRTGATTAAEALPLLDPSLTIHH